MDVAVCTLLHKLTPAHIEQFVTILWSLWKNRNLKLWQQTGETTTQFIKRAMHLLEEWRHAQTIRSGSATPSTTNEKEQHNTGAHHWSQPEPGRYV